MSSSLFTKLSKKHRSLNGYSQVWLAEDHILVVRSVRLRESYQRFLLSDIQAIVITNGPDPTLPRAAAGVVILIWIIWAATTTAVSGQVFLWSTGAIAAALLVREVLRGPHCRCVIQTAVSRERIPALSRTREARRFVDVVAPLIESAQQGLSLPEAPINSDSSVTANPAAAPPVLRRESGYVLEAFFVLLFLTAILTVASPFATRNELPGIVGLIYTSELALGGIAIAYSRSRAKLLVTIAAVALLFVLADCLFLMGPQVWRSFADIVARRIQPKDLNQPVSIPAGTLFLSVGWRILGSAAGLFACRVERNS